MVAFRSESACICATCQGGSQHQTCVGTFIGGWTCMCRCHSDEAYKNQRIKEWNDEIAKVIAKAGGT